MLTHSCSTLGDFCKGRGETHKALGGGTSFSQPVRVEVNQLQSWGSAGLRSHSRDLIFIYPSDHSLINSLCVYWYGCGSVYGVWVRVCHCTGMCMRVETRGEPQMPFLLRVVHLACLRQGLSQRTEADQLGQVG